MNQLNKMIFVISTDQVNEKLIKLLETIRLHAGKQVEILIASSADEAGNNEYLDLATNTYQAKLFTQETDQDAEQTAYSVLKYASKNNDYDGVISLQAGGKYAMDDIKNCIQAFYDEDKPIIFASENDEKDPTYFNLTDLSAGGLIILPLGFLKNLVAIEDDLPTNEAQISLLAKQKEIDTVRVPLKSSSEPKTKSDEDKNPVMKLMNYNSMIIRFIISSGTTFIIDNGLFTIVLAFFAIENFVAIVVATAVARIISSAVNYLMNRYFVFQGSSGHSGIKYFSLVAVKLVASSLMVSFVNSIFTFIHTTILKILVDGVLFALSYVIQKKYIFGQEMSNQN